MCALCVVYLLQVSSVDSTVYNCGVEADTMAPNLSALNSFNCAKMPLVFFVNGKKVCVVV